MRQFVPENLEVFVVPSCLFCMYLHVVNIPPGTCWELLSLKLKLFLVGKPENRNDQNLLFLLDFVKMYLFGIIQH
jgi:hypothetical protein